MEVRPLGRLVRAREVQPRKASLLMVVTFSMVIETSEVHPLNALGPMVVTPAGTSTCPFASGVIQQAPAARVMAVASTRSSRSRPLQLHVSIALLPRLVEQDAGRGMQRVAEYAGTSWGRLTTTRW